MIATLGSRVKVRLYPSGEARDRNEDGRDVLTDIISAGPRGVVADWGLTEDRQYVLVRKPKHTCNHYEAIEGERPL